ncbi:hormogonium polysaccharide biosynthesis glycosyltransferase HpsE [Okeania sp.]|uniref:hormogonium polysaccharide biosynthesis glycosyltransferase HpsE n=1 Tax=Okeania sp. TaxID=3100323 RepID=UPI002B4B2C17|nr:hormogonium polysaccharide biosynthesis glycosyltransferase HpsE [Okeania sp.]MEB3341994.1 hormogonium polysaccharide biosynthesis glycosyltransferase HpsE [Okeania sp.]
MNRVDFTVAIPTYNGEARLPDVLDKLKSQIDTENFSWEVIVVDNNSTDKTAEVVGDYANHQKTDWPKLIPLRYAFAAKQGAAFARERAVEKARGEFIGFLDDDNLPAPEWVSQAYSFGKNHPQVGAFGSQIHGYFFEQNSESELPENFKEIACFLGIINRGNKPSLYKPKNKMLPPGAGVVVRKQAWEKAVPKTLFLNHTDKEAGLASEDLEALRHIQQAGWEIWYNPAMVVHHKIPNWRLKKDYLLKVVRCVGLSRNRMRMMTLKSWQKPLAFPAYMANDWRQLVLHRMKKGKLIKTDTVTACQTEFLWNTIKSPFFLWAKQQESQAQARSYRRLDGSENWLEIIATAIEEQNCCCGEQNFSFKEQNFCLYGQSISPISNQDLNRRHLEILLRIEDRKGKIILPGKFIPTAERYNFMGIIDKWVIWKLLSQLSGAKVQDNRCLYEINISAASVNDETFVDFLRQQFDKHEISPEIISLGISESIAIYNKEKVAKLMKMLKEIGCQFTLDNAGHLTSDNDGYLSSMSEHIKQLPIDYLKIDSKLIQGVINNSRNLISIEKIHSLGDKLGIKTIAEAVENSKIMDNIITQGLHYAQGYAIDSPKPLRFT